MKFDVYGRFQVEVTREGERWAVYRLVPGKRIAAPELVVPPDITADEVAQYLDDLFHESASPGKSVRLL